MWLTKVAIERRVTISMVILFLIVMGFVGLKDMPWESDPEVDIPYVSVGIPYPGAGPQEIEQRILIPLEDAVSVIDGVESVSSAAFENYGQVVIEFNLDKNVDVAASDVRDALDRTKSRFPDDAQAASLYKIDINAMPIFVAGVTGHRAPRDLRKLVDDEIRPRLGQVPGVASVSVTGGQQREIQVLARKDRLDAVGLSIAELASVIRLQNMDVPSGSIKEGLRDYAVRVLGEFKDMEQIRDLMVRTPLGGPMPLRSLAEVRDTVAEADRFARVDGKDSVTISVVKQSDANTVKVAKELREALTELVGEFEDHGEGGKKAAPAKQGILPEDIQVVVATDESEYVMESIRDVRDALLFGALLASFVVFLFLHNFRGMIIVALAIPTSMMATFLPIGLGFGFSLNMMVMLGLSLSVGILVDDSIVVLENIERHLHRGEQPKAAAFNGRTEIGGAAVAITLVDVVVFVPVALMGGIIGRFFFSFGITAFTCTMFSLLMGFTLTPMLASWWYRRRTVGHHVAVGGFWHRFFGGWDAAYARLEAIYARALRGALRHPYIVFLVGIGSLVAVVALLMPRLPFEFFPASDRGQVSINIEAPVGTRIEETDRIVRELERRVNDKGKYPEVQHVSAIVGSQSSGGLSSGESGGQYGNLGLTLYRKKVRQAMNGRSDRDLAKDLRQDLADLPSVIVKVTSGGGMGGPGGNDVDLSVLCEDQDTLGRASAELVRKVSEIDGLLYVDLSAKPGRPEIHCEIDRLRANDLGLSVAAIGAAVRTAFAGDDSAKYREGGDEYDLRVQLADVDRHSVQDVGSLYVGLTSDDAPVMLRDLADVFLSTGPSKIERFNRQRMVSLTATLDRDIIAAGPAQKAIDEILEKWDVPGVTTEWAGNVKMMVESFGFLVEALILAILLVYIVTAALYNSLLQPLIVMITIPMAIVGGMLGLWVTGNALSVVAMIGVIQLVGLVGKNAILIVDYTNTLRARGLERTAALLEAGPTRMKPVLMTAISAIAGALPIALAVNEGSEWRSPMAVVVIFGLALSTLLSLLVVPCTYAIMDGVQSFFGRIGRRIARAVAARNGESDTPDGVPPPAGSPPGWAHVEAAPAEEDDRWARPRFASDRDSDELDGDPPSEPDDEGETEPEATT